MDLAKNAAKEAAGAADTASVAAAGTTVGAAGAADAQKKLVKGKDKGGGLTVSISALVCLPT